MTQVNINLASRPFRNNAALWLAFGLAFVVLSAFTGLNVWQYRRSGAGIEEWSGRRQEAETTIRTLAEEVAAMNAAVARVDLATLDERSAFANAIIRGRLFSWTILFDRLEEVLPETVRLRSIRPAIRREGIEVQVNGLSRDYGGILRFEENLLDSDYFTFVYPMQESRREAQGEIQFSLVFGYLPEGKIVTAAGAAGAPPVPPEGEPVPSPGEGEEDEAGAGDEEAAPEPVEEAGEAPSGGGGAPEGRP